MAAGPVPRRATGRGRVEVEGLTWRPFGRRQPVLREVSLSLDPGERVLLVGASGSGKSTLLRALAGLLETVDAGELSGSVTVDGVAPGTRPGAVGLVLQEPGAGLVAATVGRDVAFGPENVGMPRARMPAVVAEALGAVGLGDLPLDTPTSALSGGQTQRLALAGTLALDPTVLLLDEPTAMLDPGSAAEVRAAVAELAERDGRTLVVVEHVLGPWVDLVDRIVVLSDDGRIVADGPVRRVLERERDRLLDLGIWVPGAPPPDPVTIDPELVRPVGVASEPAGPPHAPGLAAADVGRSSGEAVTPGGAPGLAAADVGRSSGEAVTPGGAPGLAAADVGRSSAESGERGGSGRGVGSPSAALPLAADPLAVDRTTRLLDGTSRTHRAATLPDGLTTTPGSLSALVGPSGSGKSTLLHALAGFVSPTPPGAVRLGADGVDPASLDARALAARLAWVPQWSSSTIVARTVLDEVLATDRALGRDGDAARARALLAALGLAHLEQADPRELSGGEQRRLAVAAALLHGPPVLLADEPTVGQDRHTWAALVGLVAAYRSAGGAVVAATHDRAVVDRAHSVHELHAAPRPAPDAERRVPLVARCSPLALLLATLLAVPAGIVSPHWSTSVAVLAVQLVLAVLGLAAPGDGPAPAGRARRVAVRMLPGLLAALSVGWSTWWLAGHDVDAAATVALRVLVIVLPSAVLVPWIDPDALGDHLAQRLRLPDRPVVATAAALQRVHTFADTWAEIGRARRVRGLGVSWRHPSSVLAHLSALTMGLLVRTLRSAAELAVAMDARGFATAQRRSWWAPAPWRVRDSVLLTLSTLPLLVAVLAR